MDGTSEGSKVHQGPSLEQARIVESHAGRAPRKTSVFGPEILLRSIAGRFMARWR